MKQNLQLPFRYYRPLLCIAMGLILSLKVFAQLPTAQTVASQIKIGWNIGNTLEVPGSETGWGNPMVNQQLINSVKAAGFNAVRIPCAWDSHANQSTQVIDAAWLARVKQVVDYCINNNMYVILNIHWDGGWLEEHPLYSYQTAVNAKQTKYWTQIANYFKSYNERLLFAGTNEVHADYNTPTTENINVQQSYNQTFVNAVRATGGNNSSRTLVVQTYNTNPWHGLNYFSLPSDPTSNRLIVEVHNYDPYDFTLNLNGGCLYWGSPYPTQSACSWAQESYFDDLFSKIKTKWIDKGVPVIIGEYAVTNRSALTGQQRIDHVASRQYYLKYVTAAALSRGIKSFYWDIGTTTNGSGLFDRNTGAVTDQGALNAVMQGAGIYYYATIKNRATNLLIDGMYRSTDGVSAGQYSSSGTDAQLWLVELAGSYVRLRNRATGLYLDGMGRTTNGSIAGQYSSGGSYNQQWTLETAGSYFKLKNRGTGLYIDGLGNTTNGVDLAQWLSSTSNNQQWTITKTSTNTARTVTNEVTYHEDSELEVQFFPNPFTSTITIVIHDPKSVKNITALDFSGREIEVIEHDAIRNEQSIGSQWKSGMYILQVNGMHKSQTYKVVKK